MEWQQVSMSSVDAQFQEIRKQQLYEICRIWRIPPILLQDPEKSSLNNTETLGRFFLSYTLQPLLEAWEQSLQLSLLTRGERRQYYLQHDLNEFQRAESQARWTANVAATVNEIMTVNEVRAAEHLPPVEGGDERRVPVNTAPWQQGAVGQTAHAVNPSQTMLAPLNPGNQTQPARCGPSRRSHRACSNRATGLSASLRGLPGVFALRRRRRASVTGPVLGQSMSTPTRIPEMPKIRLDEDLQRLENPNVAATIQASRNIRAGNAALQQARGGDASDTALRGRAMAAVRRIERNAEQGRRMASIQANRPGISAPYQDTGRVSPEAVSRRSAFAAWIRNGEPQAALQTSGIAGGGIFVPIEISQTIRENLVLVDQIRRVASAVTTSTDTLRIPKRSAATTAQWLAEGDTALPTDPTYGAIDISVDGARAYVDISNETLANSAIDIEAWITHDLTKELARLEGAAFVNGTGTKQPQGLLQSADIASVATGDANLVTANSISGCHSNCPPNMPPGPALAG